MNKKKLFLSLFVFGVILFGIIFVSAPAWDVSNTNYDNVNFSVQNQEYNSETIFFNASGNKMYILGSINDTVFQYTLSTPWNISTASYDGVSYNVSSQSDTPTAIFFNASGNKMYVGGFLQNMIFQYTLSTPWSVSTASYDNVNYSVTESSNIRGLFFNSSGDKMYMELNNIVFQYTLSTPWNISTASYDNKNYTLSNSTANIGLFFNSSGNKMYIGGSINSVRNILQYTLSTPWNISTASYDGVSYNVNDLDVGTRNLFFNSSGDKMYTIGVNNIVFQYSLVSCTYYPGTGAWEIMGGDNCTLSTSVNLGSNAIRIMNGALRISSTGSLNAKGCFVSENSGLYVADGGKLHCRK